MRAPAARSPTGVRFHLTKICSSNLNQGFFFFFVGAMKLKLELKVTENIHITRHTELRVAADDRKI